MRWRSGRRSTNVEDRRGRPSGRAARGAKLGGGALVIGIIGVLLSGGDLSSVLKLVVGSVGPQASTGRRASSTQAGASGTRPSKESDQLADFISVVLADTEDTWKPIFKKQGRTYKVPKLVLFSGSVQTERCGHAGAAVGPFYCPPDQKVYIDLSFFRDLHSRFKAPGDFAQAYVVAHEIGHHVQTLLGVSKRVTAQRRRLSKVEGNKLSVRQELQADCFSGIWAHHANRARKILEKGDIEEGLTAAAAIGDDRLQKQARGHVTPESWTHGSSAQRVRWFKVGLKSGCLADCDTFSSTI